MVCFPRKKITSVFLIPRARSLPYPIPDVFSIIVFRDFPFHDQASPFKNATTTNSGIQVMKKLSSCSSGKRVVFFKQLKKKKQSCIRCQELPFCQSTDFLQRIKNLTSRIMLIILFKTLTSEIALRANVEREYL